MNIQRYHSIAKAACALLISSATLAHAQTITTEYGIEFCTVGAVGNAPVPPPPPDGGSLLSPSIGRGRVDYEYRIGRTEITTAQYVEFANVAYGVPVLQRHPNVGPTPYSSGAFIESIIGGGGLRYAVSPEPGSAMRPVFGVSWYLAALYCNWLHNGKSNDPASLYTGAYDTSTWGYADGQYTDGVTHLPGARFWIPTIDEQIKAFHYDPNRFGVGQGGYWLNKNMRDIFGQSGAPGVGQTSAGYNPGGGIDPKRIPLGSYPNEQSPWGLLDTSGGTTEWNELFGPGTSQIFRRAFGAAAGTSAASDNIYGTAGAGPSSSPLTYGFRIATSIPSPTTTLLLSLPLLLHTRSRRGPRAFSH